MGKWITAFRLALAALLAVPLLAHAAGLGRLTVQSALGQPLNAEIEIVSLQPGQDDSLLARLASQEAFRQAGIEMSSALVGVRFSIERRAGRPIIRLSTLNPVNEPFLDVLVELQWATGRLVREYTFLLDPPEYKGPQPIAAAPPPAERPALAPEPARPVPPVETRPITAAPAPAAPAAVAAAGSYEVKKGDTLGAIARDNRPAGVTFNQMLIALYRANQSAFIRENINLVRAGRILTIPDRNAIEAVDAAEANRLVQTHHAEFAEYRRQLAAAVAAAPAPVAREREVAGRITAKPGAPAPAEAKDQLKLSRADPAKPGAPVARAAREDDRVARERALKDAQSRVGDLEKNVGDLQKLLEIKNQQLAELEKQAGAKPAAVAPGAPKPAPEGPKPSAEAAKPAAEAPKPAPDAGKAPEATKPAVEAPKPAAAAPKRKPKAAPPPPPPPPSLVDEFLDNPVALGGLGGVVVLLAGYGIWAWRRKRATQTKFQDSVLGGAATGAAPAAAAAAEAGAAPTASLGKTPPGAIESEEVDPIAEADVYMAYGRDAQAEEILKEALGKDANRVPVLLKLLEIYSGRRDKRSFEQTALKVKNLTNGAGPEWEKAAALGRSLDPASGLYGGTATDKTQAMPQAGATTTLDFDIGAGEAPATPAPGAAATLDFDLGATSPGIPKPAGEFTSSGTLIMDKPSATAKAPAPALDFNLGDTTTLRAQTMPAPAVATAPAAADNTIDFDLNLDLGGAKPEAAAPRAAEAPLDLGTINLDLGASSAGGAGMGDAKWQEVSTKLDLAKAYEEMGDKDGARELLNEVLKEGDAAQQGQAKQMLANLG